VRAGFGGTWHNGHPDDYDDGAGWAGAFAGNVKAGPNSSPLVGNFRGTSPHDRVDHSSRAEQASNSFPTGGIPTYGSVVCNRLRQLK